MLGSVDRGDRANYGASPGDRDHREPYLYAGPWREQEGALWNAVAFVGAELTYAELLGASDQLQAGLGFLRERFEALRRG